jgi:acetyltransferase-like isoleucine patch superfamily enzyme
MGEPKIKKAGIVDTNFGDNVTVVEPANIYGATIGDNTFIGPFVEIQRGAVIGKRCKIQSHAFVCDLVTIGDDTVVAHGVMFINDLFKTGGPANNNRDLWAYTKIGSRVSIGSNATILAVNICDNVVIGAGSVVTKDITKPGIYAGNPAKFLRSV